MEVDDSLQTGQTQEDEEIEEEPEEVNNSVTDINKSTIESDGSATNGV